MLSYPFNFSFHGTVDFEFEGAHGGDFLGNRCLLTIWVDVGVAPYSKIHDVFLGIPLPMLF